MVQPARDGGLSGKMTADFYTADAPTRRYTTTSSAVRASPQRTVPATEARRGRCRRPNQGASSSPPVVKATAPSRAGFVLMGEGELHPIPL